MQLPEGILGIDVSVHQPLGRLNWRDLHDTLNVHFAVARSGYGIGPDDTCGKHLKEAQAGGVELLGAYQVLRPMRPIRPQVDILVRALEPFGADTMPVLDAEVLDGMTPQEVADAIMNFVETAEGLLFRQVIVYSYPWFLLPLPLADRLKLRALWLAQYPGKSGAKPKLIIPKPWTDYTIWQFDGDKGLTFNGIDTDVNCFRGTVEQMKAELIRSPLS